MSASLLGPDWTKLTRRRSYRPKKRSSQLNSVCTIPRLQAETQINNVFVLEVGSALELLRRFVF